MPERTLVNGVNITTAITTTTKPTATPDNIQQHQPQPLHQVCASLNARITAFLSADPPTERLRRVQEQTQNSLSVLQEALKRYSPSELSISYNGGKDCLVLLLLLLAALDRWSQSHQSARPNTLPSAIQSVYIISHHPFHEVDRFVDYSVSAYALDLARYAMPMKLAFETYLCERPLVKAILVGTRRTDPHGGQLTSFDETDHGWPSFMRVHPVIDWHYAEIWAFIRHLEIPYCPLYDQGYTSLGGTTDTHPNPVLLVSGGEDLHFRPAYELVEDEEERLGRDRVTSKGITDPER